MASNMGSSTQNPQLQQLERELGGKGGAGGSASLSPGGAGTPETLPADPLSAADRALLAYDGSGQPVDFTAMAPPSNTFQGQGWPQSPAQQPATQRPPTQPGVQPPVDLTPGMQGIGSLLSIGKGGGGGGIGDTGGL